MTRRLVVIDVVGLTPALLDHMPTLRSLAARGSQAPLGTVLPAVTCSAQATFLTGEPPSGHGIVGNGWYFRELGDVLLWRQHNALVGGEKVWDAARKVDPDYTVANICWWYAMGADTDYTVTPRPIYHADGKKEPDCYTRPPELHDELTSRLGEFPLFTYWGPTAAIDSSRWIAHAARRVLTTREPDLTLVYLPHLDYDLQRYGPDSPQARAAAAELDAELGPLLDAAREKDATVLALSEYGITPVSRQVHINRRLREAGLLEVHTQAGMEYLDPWVSRAFAVADHQIAHVYVRRPEDLAPAREALTGLPGIAELLDDEGKAAQGLDHPRAGDLVAVAEPDAWFTYYYWLDDAVAPDFAPTVEIHRKPGYDPAELFFNPEDRLVKARAGAALVRKKVGLRYRMNVIPLDGAQVRGSHGRLPTDRRDQPVLICSDPEALTGDEVPATDVKALLLHLAGLDKT
ncbi:alkaline phosphatase family protein [Streptomyces profundus]|uniref:alkaline phosphatase family protein n=1 Tax=Streptomyces profundus TaxID=2867410 RepID=UPI001D16AB2F|nr:nucleotide pyrophosphatase/phosphodiesterase family protein [Streptomyces sp. MA3_2.13]UED84153.1 alkaline phosphatase family protein [Streptomyces sp. MA3_2.13]